MAKATFWIDTDTEVRKRGERQYRARKPLSPLVFLLISTNFTSTPGIPLSSLVLQLASFECSSRVEPWAFTPDLTCRLRTLYAQ